VQTVPAGIYNGLFCQTNAAGVSLITEDTTGLLRHCVLQTNGCYSGRLECGGGSYSFSGMLDPAGTGAAVVFRGGALSNLNVTLQLDGTGKTAPMTGAVSNMDPADPWVAPLTAHLAANGGSPPAKFLLVWPPPEGRPDDAPANCTCELDIASNGVVSLFGRLGDGTPITQTVPVAADGSVPVYVSLCHNSGLLAGWLNLAAASPVGNLTWIHPAGLSSAFSARPGFTNLISIGAAAPPSR